MASEQPFSRLRGGLRTGARFFERIGALGSHDPPPKGVVDRLTDLANPAIDVARVHPDVCVFFENTAGLELLVRSRWRFPFSIVWRLARPIMRWLGQFVLPIQTARIVTRVFALDPARDGRPDVRAVIREYESGGDVMQAVAYATSARGATRYMNAAFPLLGGHLTGLLRLDVIGEDDEGRTAVVLTSRSREGDDAGVYFVFGSIALPLPLREHLRLWAPAMRCAPSDLARDALEGATIIGRHDQYLFGVRMVTHDYWFRPLPPSDDQLEGTRSP